MNRKTLCTLLMLFLILSVFTDISISSKEKLNTEYSYRTKEVIYQYDFTKDRLSHYMNDSDLFIIDRQNMDLRDSRLYGRENRKFVFSGTKAVGDSFGLEEGVFKCDVNYNSGNVHIGTRTQKYGADLGDIGFWFTIKDGKLIVQELDSSNLQVEVDLDFALNKENTFKIVDKRNEIIFSLVNEDSDAILARIEINKDTVLVFDGKGNKLAEKINVEVSPAGFWSIVADDFNGYIDNVENLHVEIDQSLPKTDVIRPIDYTYWVAHDDLDRETPTYSQTGPTNEEKIVGLFYFICITGAEGEIQDNTKLYLELGADGLNERLTKKSGEGFWAEPYFGYYKNSDTWIYRKHAYMFNQAGIDFIFIDISNDQVFKEAHTTLFDTWLEMRKEGTMTPQICFLTGNLEGRLESHLAELMTTVYSEENYDKYKDLFFMWEGKPLIFGNPDILDKSILDKFTVRGAWAWTNKDGYWNWLMEYPQPSGRNFEGFFEQMSVTMGHHASSSKGRSFVSGVQPTNGKNDFEFSLDTSRYGLGFKQQFDFAIEKDPQVIMITQWNEWIASSKKEGTRFANTNVDGYTYVDLFNPEFSRDGEPMKMRDGVGFGDNYYYQMINYIREFKGTNKIKGATGQKKISVNGDLSEWSDVGPEYRDSIGDVQFRNEPAYNNRSREFRYINNTGRNDFDYLKVSQDNNNVYFLAKVIDDIIFEDESNWMNIFINIDNDIKTGWEGYDYVINRSRDGSKVSVDKFINNSWETENVGEGSYNISGNIMEVSVPKEVLSSKNKTLSFDFKWADNSVDSDNVMQFMDLGDTAPNDRFSYRYIGTEGYTEVFEEEENKSNLILIIIIIALVVIVVEILVVVYIKRIKKNKA